MNEIILSLLMWTSAEMSQPVPEFLPKVVFKDECTIARIYDTNFDCERLKDPMTPRAAALHMNGTIVLPDTFDIDNMTTAMEGVLVHELVHYVQWTYGVQVAGGSCVEETLEKPAYDIHRKYVEDRGADFFQSTGLDEFTLQSITTCHPGY